MAKEVTCFDSTEFEFDSFDPDVFVATQGRVMDLQSLLNDLKSYHSRIKLSLVEVINKDYEKFVELSKTLGAIDEKLCHATTPVAEFKTSMESVKLELKSVMIELETILVDKKKMCWRRNQLMALRSVFMILTFLEKSLFDAEGKQVEIADLSLLTRISVQMSSLQSKILVCDKSSMNYLLEKRINDVISHFTSLTSRQFLSSLSANDAESLSCCFQIYSNLSCIEKAEDTYRTSIVAPYMKEQITASLINDQGLDYVFEKILQFFPDKTLFITRVTARSNVEFNFEINSVFVEAVDCLLRNCAFIFIPANWRQFHQRYRSSFSFLSKFEQMFHSETQVTCFRNHPHYKLFSEKWSLPVYFQLLFQEIVSHVENTISSSNFERSKDADKKGEVSDFHFVVPATIVNNLKLLWSDEAYIKKLAHKFLKLTLQICLRYLQWTRGAIEAVKSGEPNPVTTTQSGDKLNEAAKITRNSAVILLFDVERSFSQIQVMNTDKVQNEIRSFTCTSNFASHDFLLPFTSKYQEEVISLRNEISKNAASKCLEALKPINDVQRMFWKTNRPPPTSESVYARKLSTSIIDFMKENREELLNESYQCISVDIVNIVNAEYRKSIQEICENRAKIDNSLKKIKSTKSLKNIASDANLSMQNGSTTFMTDSDKIYLQLYLDVQYFVGVLGDTDLGSVLNSLDSTTALISQIDFASELEEKARLA